MARKGNSLIGNSPIVHVVPVTVDMCNLRHQNLDDKVSEIVKILRGTGQLEDMGLVGEIRDIKRDRKWMYALLTAIGIPTILLIVNFLMRGT